jgi:hypothetical protein
MGCEHNFPEFQGFISKNPWTVGAIFVKLKGLFAKWWVENMFPESLGVHMKNSCIAGTVFGKFKSFFCKTTDICPIWTVDWADPMAGRGPRRGHSPLPPYWPGILVNHLNASKYGMLCGYFKATTSWEIFNIRGWIIWYVNYLVMEWIQKGGLQQLEDSIWPK